MNIVFFACVFLLVIIIGSASGLPRGQGEVGWCNKTLVASRDPNVRKKITNVAVDSSSECFFKISTANCYANEKRGAEYLFSRKRAVEICAKYGGYMLMVMSQGDARQLVNTKNRSIALGLTKISFDKYTWDTGFPVYYEQRVFENNSWHEMDMKPEEHAFTVVYEGIPNNLIYHSYKNGQTTPFEVDVVCEQRIFYPEPNATGIVVDESECDGTKTTTPGGSGSGGVKINSLKEAVVKMVIVIMLIIICVQ